MAAFYISRTLLADKDDGQRLLTENDLVDLKGPLIILGDPGLGKTRLTETLENTLGGVRTTGGTFYRNENPNRFVVPKNSVLIIDGLDEITSSSGRSAVDEVLRKLSQIGLPRFILSCRAADWQGSADRHKIAADYGIEPTTLLLQPFSFSEAVQFLKSVDETLDGEEIVSTLDARDLGELCGNPLTLMLVAELAKDRQGLPENRSDLFIRACELLIREENPAHHSSQAAKSTVNDLLDSAGAVFAHLLLSGSLGIADRPRNDIPDGFISKADLSGIPSVSEIEPVLKTRLFQSAGENLSIPLHRVIAEFLGARWLSKRISNDLSVRRILQSLNVDKGVPTALRGLHAWLAFFNDGVADRCIRNDPYGVLRYGEPARLSIERARLLWKSLALLANEDPYFRSEDLGRKALVLDTLEIAQDYIRNGDTDGWDAFWNGDTPKDENTCRHRIVDQMRPRMPLEITILPETLMPEAKRADIVAIHEGHGVPTEVKGQWHAELWDAAKVQLIEKYARDWRADGRGIYLVLWCGNVAGKSMPKHPDALAAPTTPLQLREMLLERLSESERSKIDVVVFDISKPKHSANRL